MHNLDKLKETLEEIEVPYDKLAQGRKQAYQSVQVEKKRKQEWRYRLVLGTICLAVLVLAIRFVPTMTNTADPIPIPETETVSEQAVSEAFFERLAITEKKNDLTFTLEGVAVEAKYMRVDYTLEAAHDISSISREGIKVFQNGKEINGSFLYSFGGEEDVRYMKGSIEIFLWDGVITSHENFELHITFKDNEQTTFEIPFSLEKPLPATQHYTVDREVTIQNQSFTVEDVIVSGIHTLIRFTTNPQNDMTLYSLGRIALLNERGREWATAENTAIAFGGLAGGEWELFLKNNYAEIPKKMTLVLEDVNALPKGEDYVEVEFGKNIVLKQPVIGKVDFKVKQVSSITIEEEGTEVRLSHAIDADGERFEMDSFSSTSNQLQYTYPLEMKAPVKIYFYDYPNPLHFKQEILIYE